VCLVWQYVFSPNSWLVYWVNTITLSCIIFMNWCVIWSVLTNAHCEDSVVFGIARQYAGLLTNWRLIFSPSHTLSSRWWTGLLQLHSEAERSPMYSATVDNAETHNCILPYVFIACPGRTWPTSVTIFSEVTDFKSSCVCGDCTWWVCSAGCVPHH